MKRAVVLDLCIPGSILLILTLIFRFTDLDLAIQKLFFVPEQGWVYKDMQPWRFLYDYGPLPAVGLTIFALVILIGSFWYRPLIPYRKIALFVVVLFVIGPGLIVNVIFKDHWGRPRPRVIEAFSGDHRFLYIWQRGTAGDGRSFPSGHAAMGFFLCTPYFVLRRTSKKWAILALTLGLIWGMSIGLARMIQGGHYASDIVWSWGFVYLCGVGLSYLLRIDKYCLCLTR